MQFQKNGITVSIDDHQIQRLVLDRLSVVPQSIVAPRIGEAWPARGGIYAGIARGRDGSPDYHLIVGPELDGTADWDTARAWAGELEVDGHRDFALPIRKEQALCFANVPELFQPEAYWSSEQHASFSGYAWYQYFDDGYQGLWDKTSELRARAVRRLTIQ